MQDRTPQPKHYTFSQLWGPISHSSTIFTRPSTLGKVKDFSQQGCGVAAAEAAGFEVASPAPSYRIGEPFSLPLQFRDVYGNPTAPPPEPIQVILSLEEALYGYLLSLVGLEFSRIRGDHWSNFLVLKIPNARCVMEISLANCIPPEVVMCSESSAFSISFRSHQRKKDQLCLKGVVACGPTDEKKQLKVKIEICSLDPSTLDLCFVPDCACIDKMSIKLCQLSSVQPRMSPIFFWQFPEELTMERLKGNFYMNNVSSTEVKIKPILENLSEPMDIIITFTAKVVTTHIPDWWLQGREIRPCYHHTTVLPSRLAARLEVTYLETCTPAQINPALDIPAPVGSRITGLEFRVLNEANDVLPLTKKLVSKIRV
ncbi:hypothetical protein LAZ67_16002968 [Cordylochernes scorpioides]|uniref:Uncharacterized protein n=1 Tax=Cordylochernes scorpioides TaxID=51811 RepID=A0ABY6LCF3_9ARAC|nr:hypothetical protein LAZ67_16002968 [Cordylochernes scorpioides]